MRIRLLCAVYGSAGSFLPGEIIEIDDAVAVQWIGAGVAETVTLFVEEAVRSAPETAMLPRTRNRKR